MNSANNVNFYGGKSKVDFDFDDLTDAAEKNTSTSSLNDINGEDFTKKKSDVPFRKRKFNETAFSTTNSLNHGELLEDGPKASKRLQENKAEAMMAKMGFKTGRGLGKEQQGRAEPVHVEMRQGRRGLGAEKTGLEPSFDVSWDINTEEISVEETIEWAPECPFLPLSEDESTEDWIKTGPRVHIIDNETEFIDENVLKGVLKAKTVFDELEDRDLRQARGRANPFESIRGAFFLNRAAMKMANLDAILDFQLTNPVKDGEPMVPHKGSEIFYFADVCAGPGGFTEYVLWKRNLEAKTLSPPDWCPYSAHGFGFTLKGKDDFKLHNMLAASPEMFETHYGDAGPNGGKFGDGDVTSPENLENFSKFVARATNNRGVHLFMADGGFSVEGKENIQEILSKRLYLCQILCAFKILAVGGNLVCKLFDVFTPFSAGLVYLMWRCFDKISLHKPNTSRPANSERYVIAMGFRDDCAHVTELLWAANLEYEKLEKSQEINIKQFDVVSLVPLDIIRQSAQFCQYLTESNNGIAEKQIVFLQKYRAFARNKMLNDHRQTDIRLKSLEYWKIPDVARPEVSRASTVANKLAELFNGDTDWITGYGTVGTTCGHVDQVASFVDSNSFFAYRCALLASKNPSIICALGSSQAYIWDGSRWDRIIEFNLCLPKDTVIFGEVAYEYVDGSKNSNRISVLRIIDAYFLNGKDISSLPHRYRLKEIVKFCSAISHEFSRCDLAVSRAAEISGLEHLNANLSGRLSSVVYRNDQKIACENLNNAHLMHVQGFLLYNVIRDPWVICWSKTNGKTYFFNKKTGKNIFDGHSDCFADFKLTYNRRRLFTLPPNIRSISLMSNDSSSFLDSFLDIFKLIDSKNPAHQLQAVTSQSEENQKSHAHHCHAE